jgi:hypothetical protein
MEFKDYQGNAIHPQKKDMIKNLEADLDFLTSFWDDIPVFDN